MRSRSAGSCVASLLLVGMLAGGLLPRRCAAQAEAADPVANEFSITSETSHILSLLREQWEQWEGAYRLGDRQVGEQSLTVLLEALSALGMETVPEYSRAASGLALKAAREGRFEQAHWALEAAERLDPLTSEASFARSALQRAEGDMMPALNSRMEGYLRVWNSPLRRYVWWNDLLLWILAVALLTSAFFVVVQVAVKGGGVYAATVQLLGQRLPIQWAHVAAVVVFLWPVLLPGGLVWLLIYWSLLLWSFSTTSEKTVLLLLWLLLGVSPPLLEAQRQRLALAGSSAIRALEGLDDRRLEGSLLTNLGVLATTLPDDPAVDQLLGDVHRRFGQWDQARERYYRVLAEEPDNVGALINLGVYFFLAGDLASAEELFKRSAQLNSSSAIPFYDLSETYSASYAFSLAQRNLARARKLDSESVDRWIQRAEGSRPVAVNAGLARTGEIRTRLVEMWKRSGLLWAWDELLTRSRSLVFSLALFGVAIGLGWLRRRLARALIVRPSVEAGSTLDRWRRILLPGIASAEVGHGLQVVMALLPPAVLVSLPVVRRLGYPIPWALDPGGRSLGIVAAAALLLWFLWHLWRQRRQWRKA